jgi:hypothetical protein
MRSGKAGKSGGRTRLCRERDMAGAYCLRSVTGGAKPARQVSGALGRRAMLGGQISVPRQRGITAQ